MTTFRLNFAGFVTKAEHRNAGSKPIIELSICKKNKVKEGEPDAYTWIKVTCWDAPQFLADKLVKGAFVAGSGDMTLRSYTNKDGAKAVSCEVRCTGWDLECATRDGATTPAATAPQPTRTEVSAAASIALDEPPF